jgi:hypothetical protein
LAPPFCGNDKKVVCMSIIKKFLDESLENKSIDVNFVLKDKDWDNLLDDIHFKKIIAKYS